MIQYQISTVPLPPSLPSLPLLPFQSNQIDVPSAKPRNHKIKICKTNEEFKEHEGSIMTKRIAEINSVITKRSHMLWNQHISHVKKPSNLLFEFKYYGFATYLEKCDLYKESQHKDSKQKWWNNQKASEMSRDFLPSVLNSVDKMSEYLGGQIGNKLIQNEFTNYVIFELLETAINSIFSTKRSGSNEIFLRTSFQYAKSGLRKKLISYFNHNELREFDNKQRKKKDVWQRLIKEKKNKLLKIFNNKKNMYSGNNNNIDYKFIPQSQSQPQLVSNQYQNQYQNQNSNPTSLSYQQQQPSISNISYRANIISNNYGSNLSLPKIPSLPQIYTTSYPNTSSNNNNYNNYNNNNNQSCYQCVNYSNRMDVLMNENKKLQNQLADINQANQHHIIDQNVWKREYENLLVEYNQLRNNMNIDDENKNENDEDDDYMIHSVNQQKDIQNINQYDNNRSNAMPFPKRFEINR